MDGIFLVDKPTGITSHDVVNHVRRLLRHVGERERLPRVGQAGTLDPFATGLLIIGVGKATKALAHITKASKTYEAEVTFGATSSTDDRDGELTSRAVNNPPSHTDVERALQALTGTLQQVPPI